VPPRIVTATVDASVFLNAFNPYEKGHAASRALLDRLRAGPVPVIVPNLLRVEVAAAVARGRADAGLARRFADALMRLPHLQAVPLDDQLAASAAGLAADRGLRGADAVYAAVALRFGSTLITGDREQRERLKGLLPVVTPEEAGGTQG
jgi:predicted nucleic acid-binding protein